MGFSTVSETIIINLLLLSSFSFSIYSIHDDYPTANLSTVWTNNNSSLNYYSFTDRSLLTFVLLNTSNSSMGIPGIGCGFYQNGVSGGFYFVVFVVQLITPKKTIEDRPSQVLWTANKNKPVGYNATLEFTSMGDLVLKDVDGSLVWSTNTSGQSVVGMRVDGTGNLILHSANGSTIWQSFDHPTDTWLPGQKLAVEQRLVKSAANLYRSPGYFYVELRNDGFHGYIVSSSSQLYASCEFVLLHTIQIENHGDTNDPIFVYTMLGRVQNFNYIRLDSDGHLRHYNFENGTEVLLNDIFASVLDDCDYPNVCGDYGICTNGECSCPQATNRDISYFTPLAKPNLGCVPTTPLSCANKQLQNFIHLQNVNYFNFTITFTDMDTESCKQACLETCSCEAAVHRFENNISRGNCSLLNDHFSLLTYRSVWSEYNTFIKVEVPSLAPAPTPSINQYVPTDRSTNHLQRILVPTFSVLSLLVMFALCFVFFSFRKRNVVASAKNNPSDKEQDSLDQVSGHPKRFTYNELKSATGNYNKRLGGGGFGSVYGGILSDGTKIAVKCLEQFGQGKNEFLAEVKTIGSIHHVNLVRLLGFCAENSHILLVYEHMCNGSLDKWIFSCHQDFTLDWRTRRNIILDIAKGLSYLHEECQQRIIHLDIKPQNILLGGKFNAKVSDFGLARFIDRDQSQVLTAMRGTRGYLAPEWFLNRRISEKVDVYSFGVVVLEIMCGRKNLDFSQPEENEILLHLVKKKVEEDHLIDIVDKRNEDMVVHSEDAVEMIRTAIWCLQGDAAKRPSMSMIVKVLEGVMVMDNISDYSFLTLTPIELPREIIATGSAPPLASILSGPR
ncbi:hypothetical protein AQUCO_03900049v1 [Aquilegia coerulea]|uniref:Receptor-like serine/threonine-protein kinase n=1 Tax=Aquilegia coerulea TaxID=218851 RepID=A0A2G5CRM4_AQUCA|nr:hypothetical protein AQUCO_03900049v1 [Aquilegia coerulea]